MDFLNNLDVTFFVNDEEITDLNPTKIEYEPKKIADNDNILYLTNEDYFITLKNIEINEEILDDLFPSNQLYGVVGIHYNFPRGNKLPKKKRIRKKWLKKYVKEIQIKNI